MKFLSSTLLYLALRKTFFSTAFIIPSPSFKASNLRTLHALAENNEFDYLLGEEGVSARASLPRHEKSNHINRRNSVILPDSSAAATLTSSVAAPENDDFLMSSAVDSEAFDYLENDFSTEGATEGGPDMELIRKEDQTVSEISQPTTRPPVTESVRNFLQGKDFGEVLVTVFVPLTLGYWLSKKAYVEANARLASKADSILDDYANEMVYFDGDFEEMKMCHASFNKKLMWLGPKKADAMIKRYLEYYAKKKTVSPQAISSLSYVFSIYKLSEDRAAQILVELCTSMPEKAASAGKLLFFGTHILKTKEAKAALKPIKDTLASSYRDLGNVSGEEIVEKSQKAMGEAAYRAAVAVAGKDQTELTIGWEVLGLDKATATDIWSEVAKEGFVSEREAKYGSANQKYDEKGRALDKDGKLKNPEEAGDDEDEQETPTGNVFECGECGFTLFIAEGRDFKFYGADFKCPECGAEKDKFVGVDTGDI
mmetsp:Transcript_14694/g.20981  ORF Transcript_14694/g.20981 Transcript_14694/m.20981 type:complete len:483 (+) Transcript_14694:150-1598(+)